MNQKGNGAGPARGPTTIFAPSLPGNCRRGNLTFDINPAGAVVVAGEKFNNFDSSRTLSLPAKQAGAVNLLHASAWVPPAGKPVGELEIRYADHSSERIPVLAGRDCGNWWTPCHLPNGNVAWKAKIRNRSLVFTLQVSR